MDGLPARFLTLGQAVKCCFSHQQGSLFAAVHLAVHCSRYRGNVWRELEACTRRGATMSRVGLRICFSCTGTSFGRGRPKPGARPSIIFLFTAPPSLFPCDSAEERCSLLDFREEGRVRRVELLDDLEGLGAGAFDHLALMDGLGDGAKFRLGDTEWIGSNRREELPATSWMDTAPRSRQQRRPTASRSR